MTNHVHRMLMEYHEHGTRRTYFYGVVTAAGEFAGSRRVRAH